MIFFGLILSLMISIALLVLVSLVKPKEKISDLRVYFVFIVLLIIWAGVAFFLIPTPDHENQPINPRFEILKDFYDGKPVKRSEAFWEWERVTPGYIVTPEIMAKKYGLDVKKVLDTLNNLDEQYLIYSPSGPSIIASTEVEAKK